MHRGQIVAVTTVGVGALLIAGALLAGSVVALDGVADSRADAALDAPTGPAPLGVGADATRIDSCTRITDPGTYVLTADVEDDQSTRLSESCIRIATDDVVFDGNGHTIDGRGISDTRGVTATGTNVTVRNVTVSDWDRGIYYRNVSGGTIRGANATANGYGIDLDRSSGVAVMDNDVSGNLIGIDLRRSNAGVELGGNRVNGNHLADVHGNETA